MSSFEAGPAGDAWRVVMALFLILTLGSGFGFYNLSVYMSALAEQRGLPITELSFAITLFFLVGGVGGLLAARLIERFDLRWVMTGGAVLSGIAIALAGQVDNLPALYLLYALFGFGNAGVGLIPATTLVARWFPGANRSMALASASTGLSLGGVLITPVCVWMIADQGIGPALVGFGGVYVLAMLPLIWAFIRVPPVAFTSGAGDAATEAPGWAYNQAIRSRFFLLLVAAYLLLMGAQVGGINHLFNHAMLTADRVTAAVAVQVLAVASIAGRFFGGWVLPRVGVRFWVVLNASGQALGLALLSTASSPATIWAGAGLFGATVGNLLMLQPLILVEAFGIRSYARVYALANAITTLGVGAGPLLLGALFDAAGYGVAFAVVAVFSAVAVGVLLFAGPVPSAGTLLPASAQQKD